MCDWLAMACQVKALALESRIEAVLKAERQAQAAGGSAGGARLAELRQRERELEQRVGTANHALGIAQQPAPRRGYRGSGGGMGSVASMRAGVTTDSSTAEAIVSLQRGALVLAVQAVQAVTHVSLFCLPTSWPSRLQRESLVASSRKSRALLPQTNTARYTVVVDRQCLLVLTTAVSRLVAAGTGVIKGRGAGSSAGRRRHCVRNSVQHALL